MLRENVIDILQKTLEDIKCMSKEDFYDKCKSFYKVNSIITNEHEFFMSDVFLQKTDNLMAYTVKTNKPEKERVFYTSNKYNVVLNTNANAA